MPGSVSGNIWQPVGYQSDDEGYSFDTESSNHASAGAKVRQVNLDKQISIDEGHESDEDYESDEIVKISDRKINIPNNNHEQLENTLKTFKKDFKQIRRTVWTECPSPRYGNRFQPTWLLDHHSNDPRYPVAFVRALQYLEPEYVNTKLKGSAELNLKKIEEYLSLDTDSKTYKIEIDTDIPSYQLIGLIEAAVTYYVLLGESEKALSLATAGLNHFKDEIVYRLQDAKYDIKRDLGFPKN